MAERPHILANWVRNLFGMRDREEENKASTATRIWDGMSGGPLGLWSAIGGGYRDKGWSVDSLDPDTRKMLSDMGLSGDALTDFLREQGYYEDANSVANAWGLGGYDRYVLDTERLDADLEQMLNALGERPERPYATDFLEDARSQAYGERDTALAELDKVKEQRINSFNDELKNLASGYNTARSGVLSQQYQQNAQLMDTLSSQMDRQNRNALEAGASAGIRLAGNINTLLSTQNKQSQTSLDTANQLAQMMISQRNAEASIRGQYGDYMTQNFNTAQGIRDSAEAKAQSYANANYGAASADYDNKQTDWDNLYANNPFWERNKGVKSNYNKTGG